VAPLFFVALALACLGSRFATVCLWAASALALSVAAWRAHRRDARLTLLGLAVVGYVAVAAVHTLVASPAYTPAGLYQPLLVAMAFLVARRATDETASRTERAAAALGAGLAVWGLVQIGIAGAARATAVFEAPATYAAFLNLLLLPLLARALIGTQSAARAAIAILLAAGLFAADSRGGSIALVAGLGFAMVLALRGKLLRPSGVGAVVALLVAGWVAAAGVRLLAPAESELVPSPTVRGDSSVSRLELYAVSWNAWRESPFAGTGYLTFRYALEQGREAVPSYGEANETWFVHNDYLQTLQELGPIGLGALLGLTLLPPLLGYGRLPYLGEADRAGVVASACALAAMSVHALVDFPFYVPACLLLYGAHVGWLDARLHAARAAPSAAPRPWLRTARGGAAALGVIILLRPVAAEAAAEWGLVNLARGNGTAAAVWLGAARRIDPADWRYHWYAGQFWGSQVAQSGKREAARLAAQAYAAGFAANPLEAKNLLGMISVHRRFGHLLEAPADPERLQRWRARAIELAPLNPEVRRELAQ
jgi:hypothetical protein